MDALLGYIDVIIIVVGSVLGATKASLAFDKDKHCLTRLLDVLLGMFVGTLSAYHYGSHYSIWLMGLVSLVGGVSGAMVIDMWLQILPTVAKSVIVKKIKKLIE